MHIANVKVPSEWVKLEDLLTVGRTKFEISKAETYFIHNNSGYVLYLAEASMLPIEEPQEIKIYPGKSAGYVKDVMDLYVCSKLPEGFPYPESLSITFSNDVGSNDAIAVGDYRPDSAFRGAYVYRGTVETVADLPQDAGVGDVYDVREEGGTNYAWNGESWDDIGGIEDLSAYALKEEIPTKVSQLENDKLYVIPEELTEALAPKAEAADVVALEAKVDANMEEVGNVIAANVAALEDAIDLKADKTELEPLATKVEAEALGARIDENVAEIETKADKTVVEALEVKVDGNYVALEKEIGNAKTELEAKIEVKADKTELEPLATKEELEAAIAAVDHSTYATKEDVQAADKELKEAMLNADAEIAANIEALGSKQDADKTELYNAINLKAGKNEVQAGLDLKADKTELEPLATKEELKEAIASVDHSTYATKDEVAEVDAKADRMEAALSENIEALNDSKAGRDELEAGLAPKADKTELVTGLAPKADKTELAEVKSGLEAGLKKKVEATIESDNGQAKIFNEASGGGAQFVNTKKNTLSFVGVNDGNDGVFVQIYSKDKKSNVGARLNASPDGIYYTNGKTNASYDDADEIATKADLAEAISGVDHSTFASKEEVQAGLEVKADKAELEPLATKAELEAAIAGVDHSTFATKDEVAEVKAVAEDAVHLNEFVYEGETRKTLQLDNYDSISAVDTEGVGHNLAMISKWNVADFGATGVHANINTKDILTINDNQAVVTDKIMNNFLLSGKNVAITQQELVDDGTGFAYNGYEVSADLSGVEASVASVLARMNVLEERISDINKTDVEAVVIEGEVPSMNDETKDYVVKGNITAPATISGKSITMKDVQIDNLAKVVGTAQGDVDIKGMTIQGEYPESPANVLLDFAADGYVTIKDTEFHVGTYNAINIGPG